MEPLLQQKTLMISTATPDGKPSISYAPFINIEGKIYIYVSEMGAHYHNMIANPKVAIMMIEDEAVAKNIFARCRVSFDATATKMVEVPDNVWQTYEEVHGKEMLQMLRSLDFDMFELEVHQGRLIKGFGQAYDLEFKDGDWVKEPVKDGGHGGKTGQHPGMGHPHGMPKA